MSRQIPREAMFQSDDLMAILLEAMVRAAWLALTTAWGLAVFAVRNPVVTLLGVGLGLIAANEGWATAALTLAAVAVALVAWRLAHPGSFAAWEHRGWGHSGAAPTTERAGRTWPPEPVWWRMTPTTIAEAHPGTGDRASAGSWSRPTGSTA